MLKKECSFGLSNVERKKNIKSSHITLNLNTLQNRLGLIRLPPSILATRETKLVHTLRLHFDRVARIHGRNIVPILDATGVEKVLVQMVHVLEDTLLAAHDDIVNGRKMLRVLWQADAARVRYNGNVELCGHEQDGNDFVYAAETAGVDLANVDGARGEELLEHDAVLAHFAGGDADVVGLEGFADGFVAQDCFLVLISTVFVER